MKLHIKLNPYTAAELLRLMQVEEADAETADAVVVFDFAPEVNPVFAHKTVAVVMGPYNMYAEMCAQNWIKAGISPENIIIAGGEDLKSLAPQIKVRGEALRPKKKRVVAFFAPKGGTGKTTFAASLADHYAGLGEKAIVVDLCAPPNAAYHVREVLCSLDAAEGYDRVAVDLPPSQKDFSGFDAVVLVTDADTVQCLAPAQKALNGIKPAAVVYNRARPEVSAEVIRGAFPGVPVIEVADDFANCAAALAAGVPASRKSLPVAQAVGRLAALL